MNIDELVKRISKTDGLSKTLGMHFISTPEPDTLQATMKVDERNRQPFGLPRLCTRAEPCIPGRWISRIRLVR